MEIMGAYEMDPERRVDSEELREINTITEAADLVMHAAGEAAGPALLRALEEKQPNRRLYALDRFKFWPAGWEMSFAVAALSKLATDKDRDISDKALEILGSSS